MRTYRGRPRGFTLLEVLVSLSLIAIALVVLLRSHAMNIERAAWAKQVFIATILAQRSFAELSLEPNRLLQTGSGEYAAYPGFGWQSDVFPTPFAGLKRVVFSVLVPYAEKRERKKLVFEWYADAE